MKFISFFLLLPILLAPNLSSDIATPAELPASLLAVIEAHGGLETWRKQQFLSYEIERETGNEKQHIHLWDRREKIEAPNFQMGYDGSSYWLQAGEDYKGNPKFYKGLMFYFYAMPFVLADDGIVYGETDPLVFEGKSYPGIRISYEANIGVSPKDEYFIHYDPETHRMAWLGYTVTFRSQEKSDDVRWIRYDDWGTFNGLQLPNSMSWYQVNDAGKPTQLRNTRVFSQVNIREAGVEDSFWQMPAGAKVVE